MPKKINAEFEDRIKAVLQVMRERAKKPMKTLAVDACICCIRKHEMHHAMVSFELSQPGIERFGAFAEDPEDLDWISIAFSKSGDPGGTVQDLGNPDDCPSEVRFIETTPRIDVFNGGKKGYWSLLWFKASDNLYCYEAERTQSDDEPDPNVYWSSPATGNQ